MGFLKKVYDPGNIAGGLSGETAAKGTALSIAEQRAAREEAAKIQQRARLDALGLFPAAQRNAQMGFQGALDIFRDAMPQQIDASIAGNVGAQQALLSGLPQQQAAILGGNVDFSAMQPFKIQRPDLSFLDRGLPDFINSDQIINREDEIERIMQEQNPAIKGTGNSILGGGLHKGRF